MAEKTLRTQRLERYPRMLAEKAMELANMSLFGIVLSQFLADEPFRVSAAFLGTIAFVFLHVGAFVLMRGGEE